MSETDNQHEVSVVYEYKIEKGHSWSSQFLVEYKNGQKTEYRKCVKCDSCIFVDTERMFSFARLNRNFLQNRLSTASHSRNVFLNRKKLFSRK